MNVAGQNKIQKPMTDEQKQKKLIDKAFEADYIFEAEILNGGDLTHYLDSAEVWRYYYQSLIVTKIYRGDDQLKLGSIKHLVKGVSSWFMNPYVTDQRRAIFFANKSDYPSPILQEQVDNKVFVSNINHLIEAVDSLGRKFHAGLGDGHNPKLGVVTYDVDKYLKTKKNIHYEANRMIRTNSTADSIGNSQRERKEKEEQEKIRKYHQQRFQEIYDRYDRFKKDSAAHPERKLEWKKWKEKGAGSNLNQQNFRIESISTGTASVEYAIRNKSLTNDGVNNYYEFDITAKPSATIYMDVANLLFSANKDVLGNTPMSSGKFTITKATAFSNSANNYRAFTFDGSALGGFDLQFVAIPVVPSTSTTPSQYISSLGFEQKFFLNARFRY